VRVAGRASNTSLRIIGFKPFTNLNIAYYSVKVAPSYKRKYL
jgi:hypothetical protein